MSKCYMHLNLLLMLLFCCVSPSSFVIAENYVVGLVACSPRQIQALRQFKNEFDTRGCNHSDYSNGVWCDNSTGAITKLQLRACLSGTLKPNSSLFNLHHLRYLNLSENNFTSSSLPSEFGNLKKLEVLSLSSNGFLGQVPSSFSNLNLLSSLSLSNNDLTGSFPLIQNLTKLLVLDLSSNNFSGTLNPKSALFELHQLRDVILSNNYFSSSLPLEFGNLKSLEILHLSSNSFFGQVPPTIAKLTLLSDLRLDQNELSGSFPLVRNLSKLSFLDLSHNYFSGTLTSNSGLFELHQLHSLILFSNDFNSSLPSEFGNLNKLEFLYLFSNGFSGQMPLVRNLSKLFLLDLSHNYFSGTLSPNSGLFELHNLRYLSLGDNNFSSKLPSEFGNLNMLKVLSLPSNSFTREIPLSICNMRFLSALILSYNNFTGQIPPCLSKIKFVNLRHNKMEGRLPDNFYVEASVQTLDVGHNQLVGKLPKSLLNCSSLRVLAVDHNSIKDTFPFWLKALSNLKVFILRSNKFYGSISPPDQGPLGFSELRILEISDNNFTGSLPPNYFMNWKASSSLPLNEDGDIYMEYSITAKAPKYYAYIDKIDLQYKGISMEQEKILTFYAAIDFSGNKLEGQIPESIGHLKALIALNLSNNTFTGHIPLSLANLTELESLDLSSNQLSGTIPNGLGSLSFLAYINVSYNQLKGEIPQGTQFSGQAESSFEGNAGLCGLPLQEICIGSNVPPTQQPKDEDEEGEEGEVLSWKAAAIGYGAGMLFGLTIAQIIASFKPEWLTKIIGPYKRRNH
ncbi:unnamed protein product [Brassica oleracea var. botrytis]